jgi:hypothetical protein
MLRTFTVASKAEMLLAGAAVGASITVSAGSTATTRGGLRNGRATDTALSGS